MTYDYNNNMRQWTWQYCTEFGWFQVPALTNPLRSSVLVEANWLSYCKAIFGDYYTDDMPRVDYYINKYSGISDAAKIIFLNAAEDPWQYAGMSQNVP